MTERRSTETTADLVPARRATDYPPSGIRRVFERVASFGDVIKLTVGEPNFDTPPHIVEAAVRSLRDGNTRYTPNAGQSNFRAAIAACYANDWGVQLSERNVMVAIGAAEALLLAFSVLLEPGDEILVPDPGYPNYAGQAQLLGARAVAVPLDAAAGFRMHAAALAPHVTPRTKAILLNSPSNPLGVTLTVSELQGIARFAEEHGLYVVADEVYERIVYNGSPRAPSIAEASPEFNRFLIIGSLSKSYAMTGWRTGWVIGPESLISLMPHMQEGIASCVPGFVQDAGIAALTGPDDVVTEMVNEYRRRRDAVLDTIETLSGINAHAPEGTFYLFADIRSAGLSSEVFAGELLERARVAVIPGTAFGSQGEGFIRLSYAADMSTVTAALTRIAEFLTQSDSRRSLDERAAR